MTARDTLDPLRKATRRLNEAEAERNRVLRALRSERQPLTSLSEAAEMSIGKVHSLTRPSTIASVGYEGRTVDELLDALVDAHVATLVDVRQNAISRKAGLSKRAFASSCASRGIVYVHEPTLGNPRDNRDAFRSGDPVGHETFEHHLVEQGGDALARVAGMLKDRTVALLCFEADPCSCHRSIVVKHLQRLDPLATVLTV